MNKQINVTKITHPSLANKSEELAIQVAVLRNALLAVKSDLISRGCKDSQGCVVVDCGSTAWEMLISALEQTK